MGLLDLLKKKGEAGCASCGGADKEFRCTRCGRRYCRPCLVSFGTDAARVLIEIVTGGRGTSFGSVRVFDQQGRAFCPHCYQGVVKGHRPPRADEVDPTCVAL